ncbi:MAG: MarR family winged helix-turn-helix transcriptional regulator [Chakrabartia sp.]
MNEGDNLGALIADVSHLLRRSFDERARGIGISRPQWRVLTKLNRHEGIHQGGLAELIEVEPITLCRMVDRLQEADLVERRADPADRRAWRLYLTDKARALLEDMRPLALGLFDEALTGIAPKEQEALLLALARIRANLSRRAPQEILSHG